jgi:hypothetical protein
MSTVRDNLYYMEIIIFQVCHLAFKPIYSTADTKEVESRLFRVYRQHFMASKIFRDTFSLPSGDLQAEGSSDTNPFVLHGIMANDFQALLKVINPL